MKKIVKLLAIIPMFLVFTLFGVNLTAVNASANSKTDNSFEVFSQQVVNMIGTIDDCDDCQVIFDKNNDLYLENNTLMVEGQKFTSLTGSKCSSSGFGTYTISKLDQRVELTPDDNIVTTNNDEIIYMPEPMREESNDILFSFEDVSKSLGYEIKETYDKIILTRPFSAKRLILKSPKQIDKQGAIKTASGYDNLHILQYKTESEAITAYEYYNTLNYVEWVEPDRLFTTQDIDEDKTSVQGLQDTYSYTTWGADAMGVESYSQYLINTVGSANLNNIIIAVIDTGIDTDHEWFNNRILYNLGKNFSSSESETTYEYEDVHGHGTHVAGTICDLTLTNVKILPIKVMNDQGYGYASQIMLGINYVTQLKQNGQKIVAMNLSLGSANGVGSEEHNLYTTALTDAYNNGILPVVAAGNDGANVLNHTPANIDCALTVSAIGVSGPLYYRPSWSNYGSFVDVCAPGHQIISACVGGGTIAMSGTSMAAPHIAGAVGLLMSGHNYTLSQLENIIDENVIDLGDDGWDNFYGEGLVNLEYAYADLISNVVFSNTNTDCTTPFNLALTSNETNAQIYYTKDGTTPTLENGTLYSSPFPVNATQRIKARAYVIANGNVIKYSKVSQMTYCFYGQDIDGAYTVSEDGVLTSYNGILTEVVVPKTVNGITITSIGANAFTSSNVTMVTLPSSVIEIGAYAFQGCSTIQTVYGPNVQTIDMYAFNTCSQFRNLTDSYFPELLTIGKYAFYQCYNLRPISLSKVTKVDYWAFGMKNVNPDYLTSITLPEAKIIAEGAFIFCQKLTSINIPSAEIVASGAFRECDIRTLDLPSVKYLGNHSFYVNKNLISANLPETEIIGASAFYYCTQLATVNVPKVRIIADTAFRMCSALTTIDMPELEEVGTWAFYDCDNLTSFNAPKLKNIGYVAFGSCDKLTVVNLPSAVSIGQGAFRMISGLTKVTLSSCLEEIGNNSFSAASKTTCVFEIYGGTVGEDFVVSQGYKYVDLLASGSNFTYETHYDEIYITGYSGEATTNLIIPSFIDDKPVTKILSNAFKNNTNIQTISISQLVEIENEAFSGCVNLKQLNLPRIQNIGQKAFYNCENLSNVEISNVKNIGDQAFYGCSSLLSIKLSNNIENIGNQALGYSADDQIIPTFVVYGYAETVAEEYANTENITFRAMFTNLEHFYYNTYSNNGNTEIYISFVDSFTAGNLIIPSEYKGIPITKIGPQAFYNCSFITGIILPSSIKTIDQQAFYGCTLLESINLENVTSIGTHSFWQCTSLKELNAPLLEEIPTYAFAGCNSLTIANIPNAKLIGENTFGQCYRLKTVISPQLETIQYSAFAYDYFLESIDTSNLKVLGTKTGNVITSQIFAFCENLKYLYLPKIEEIGDATFSASGVQYLVIGRNFNKYFSIPINSSIKIYGYTGSYAHTYATEKGNQFIPLDEFAITTNLSNNKQVNKEQSLTLSVASSGFGQTYQWYKATTNSTSNGVAINGIETNSYTVDTSHVGTFYYYVVVKNWDNETLTSNICAVKVIGSGNTFVITSTSSENGSISPSGSLDVYEGESQTYTFSANTGYHLSSLLIDGVAVNSSLLNNYFLNGYTFTNVNRAHTIKANYEINTYTITVIQAEHGTISNASTSYNYGSTATFSITADSGYTISKLIIDNTDYSSGDLSSYTFTNISDNHTLSAFFIANTDTAFKVNHFLESLSSDGAIYHNGAYYLLKEGQNLSGATNTMTNVMPKNYKGFSNLEIEQRNIAANGSTQVNIYYNRNVYTIAITEGSGIATTSGSGSYKFEEDVIISADTTAAYDWVNWTSDNSTIFPTTTDKRVVFKMPASNLSLTANAIIKSFEITTNVDSNGTINPNTSVVNYGDSQTFDFIPNTGYKVKNVVIDGIDMGKISSYTFLNVVSKHTISVQFEKQTYVVTFDPNGGILKNGVLTQSVAYGSNATAPTLERVGYTLNGWDKALSNITSDITIKAQWEIITYNITYHLNGGTNSENNPSTYNIESETIIFENATKTGYDFIGWYSNAAFTGNKVNYVERGSTTNVDLYAKFEAKICSVVFDLGSSRFGNITCDNADLNNLHYGDTITLTITPDTGYVVDKVYVNGIEKPLNNNKFTITNIGENTSISVSYKTATTNPPQDPEDNKPDENKDIFNNTTIIIIFAAGVLLIVLLTFTLIVFMIKNSKFKKQLIEQNQNIIKNMGQNQNNNVNQPNVYTPTYPEQPQTTNPNFRNIPPRPPIQPSQQSNSQQENNVTMEAIEFAKKQGNNFIEFCKKYNLDYVNRYNYAALMYYQAYLRSLNDKK